MVAAPAAAANSVADFVFVNDFEGPVDCSAELTCPAQAADKTCISGRVLAIESGAPLHAPIYTGSTCDGRAAGGACDLSVEAFDAFGYFSDAPTPLAYAERVVDGCGRYRFSGLTPTQIGYVVIRTDDALPVPDPKVYESASGGRPLAAGASADGFAVYAVRRDVDAAWVASAGDPLVLEGGTFADYGSVLLRFRSGVVPASGVTAYAANGFVTGIDFYFSDSDAAARTTVSEQQSSTGVDGSVLIARLPVSSIYAYTGVGGEPAGCTWPQVYLGLTPNRLYIFDLDCPGP